VRVLFLRCFVLGATGGSSAPQGAVEGGTKTAREAEGQSPNLSGGAEMRVKITLACTECKQRNYVSKKNKKNDPDRIEMMKHCKFCRKHTLHKETK
jgi:large subunit ribosomal protein L33